MAKGHPSPPKYVIPEDIKEEVRELIRRIMSENNLTADDLANKLNQEYGRSKSYRNILNKIDRASFSLAEYLQILKAYNYKFEVKRAYRTKFSNK